MSFIRKRLSRVWDRSSDESSRSSQEEYRTSISSENTQYTGKTNPSLLGSVQEASPGRLHKAASTTFQAFSDTIRAKTQMFYTNQTRSDIADIDPMEAKTPRRHGHRSTIWSSVRSRPGLTDCTNQGSAANSPGTPTILRTRLAEPAPSLDIKIPSSSFTEMCASSRLASYSPTKDSGTQTTEKGCYAPKQLWPSPANLTCVQPPIINIALGPLTKSLLLDDPYTEPPHEVMYDSAMFESGRSTSEAGKYFTKDPEVYASDSENIGGPKKADGFSPASIASQSYFTPPTTKASRTPHSGNSLFVKGNQAQGHFQRTPSPYRKIKQSQDSPSASAGTGDKGLGSSIESPLTVIRPDWSMPEFPKESVEATAGSDQPDSPLANRSNTFDLFPGRRGLEPRTAKAAERSSYIRLPSNVYEADTESAASSPGIPNMGSRHAWNEVRADRNDRYLAIRTMSETTYSDEESDSELGLSRSPPRKLVRPLGEDGSASPIKVEQKITLGNSESKNGVRTILESRCPSDSSLQKKLEALELLESSCEASTDAESQRSTSTGPMLNFYVEANNRVSGTVLDELETRTSASSGRNSPHSQENFDNTVEKAPSDLGLEIPHSPGESSDHAVATEITFRVDQENLNTPLSASSSDEGRQSFEDIEEITNAFSNDDEFEDVVQRTKKFRHLLLAHHPRFQRRVDEEEERLSASKETISARYSANNEANTPILDVRNEAFDNSSASASSFSISDNLSQLLLDPKLVGDNKILEVTVMDEEKSVTFEVTEDSDTSSPLQEPGPADQEAFTNALHSSGILRRSIEKCEGFRGNPPNTPVQASRSASTESVRTTDSCAVTTSSPLCFAPPPFPTLHVRSSPARRTSTIIAGLELPHEPDAEKSTAGSIAGEQNVVREALMTIPHDHLWSEKASSPSKPGSTNASQIVVAPSPSPVASTQAGCTLEGYVGSSESPHPFEINLSDFPSVPDSPTAWFTGSQKTEVGGQQTLPFVLKEDKEEEFSTNEDGEPSPKKVRLETKPQPLGETTANKSKKKKKPKKKKNRKTKSVDAGIEPLKPSISSPLGKVLDSIPLETSSPTIFHSTQDAYQTSSHKKGIWWARDKETFGDEQSPLVEKVVKSGPKVASVGTFTGDGFDKEEDGEGKGEVDGEVEDVSWG